MSKITLMRGLLSSEIYLHALEGSIQKSFRGVETKTNLELSDLEKYQISFIQDIEKRVENCEYYEIQDSIKEKAYFSAMLGDSRRIRPMLLFLGHLCGSRFCSRKSVVSCGLAIEYIHKMSLILDDYFDRDTMRRGKPTFYTQYDENVMLFLCHYLLKLSNTVFLSSVSDLPKEERGKLIELYQQIIMDMGTGFLQDLDRKERKITLGEAFFINDLQSTTILRNFLLIGYSLSNRKVESDDIFSYLGQIGASIGKIFQGFNDVENFLVQDLQFSNKGNLYTDLKENRKNIVLGQVPKELFYPPYKDQDILDYIGENHLLESTVEELIGGIEGIKKDIYFLPNEVSKETLLYMADKAVEKTLKRLKK